MRDKLLTLFLVLLAALLFPYMAAMVFIGKDLPVTHMDNGRYIILRDGTRIPSEVYLTGILGREIDPGTETEALKAQAVLARTWLYREMGARLEVDESLLPVTCMSLSEMSQLWEQNRSICLQRLYSAVEATMGECMFYGEQLAVPLYHEISAGSTRNDRTGDCPYLLSAECFYDAEAKDYQKVKLYSQEEFALCLNQTDGDRQVSTGLTAESVSLHTDSAGYVIAAEIEEKSFTGDELQEALSLPSCWFRLEDYREGVRVICKGKGHGYGLSQWGAQRYAQQGKDYRWILGYYFHDISIRTV